MRPTRIAAAGAVGVLACSIASCGSAPDDSVGNPLAHVGASVNGETVTASTILVRGQEVVASIAILVADRASVPATYRRLAERLGSSVIDDTPHPDSLPRTEKGACEEAARRGEPFGFLIASERLSRSVIYVIRCG